MLYEATTNTVIENPTAQQLLEAIAALPRRLSAEETRNAAILMGMIINAAGMAREALHELPKEG